MCISFVGVGNTLLIPLFPIAIGREATTRKGRDCFQPIRLGGRIVRNDTK